MTQTSPFIHLESFMNLQHWIDCRFGSRPALDTLSWLEFWNGFESVMLTGDPEIDTLLRKMYRLSQDSPPARTRLQYMQHMMKYYPDRHLPG